MERRKYRFRILNASVSRFFKYGLSDGSPMIQIAMTATCFRSPVVQTVSDEQGIAERYDWVIDFSRYNIGDKVWLVNVLEHQDGKKPNDRPHGCRGARRQVQRSLRWEVPGVPHRAQPGPA